MKKPLFAILVVAALLAVGSAASAQVEKIFADAEGIT